jgi:TPR repeat protein
MYHWGSAVGKDSLQAFTWWLKAAEKGHVIAQHNVGYSYEIGEVVQQDYVEAYKWTSLAASDGHPGAQEHCNELAARMTAEQREKSYHCIEEFENAQAEQPKPTPGWWDKAMAERQESAERYLAVLALARRPHYDRRQIPSQVRQQVWVRDDAKCKKCGSRELLHLDHIIPVSKGGSDALENLELLCQSCNLAKGAKIQ